MSASPDSWSSCGKGKLVAVDAERVLYEAPDMKEFWVHFKLRNLTAHPVGVVLKGWEVFYPNQWQGSTTPNRREVNERRLNQLPLTEVDKKAMFDAWKAKSLVVIPAQGDIDYFRVFNGSGTSRKEFEVQAAPFMIVAVDGQIRATDGTQVERVQPIEESRELSLPAPVKWAKLPANARTVEPH